MILLLVLLISYGSLFSQENTIPVFPTNTLVNVSAQLSNVEFGKPFEVEYRMPDDIASIIIIDSNITVEAPTDIEVVSFSASNIKVQVFPYGIQPYSMPSFLITALSLNGETNKFYTPGFTIPISNVISTQTNLSFEEIEQPYFAWNPWWTIILIGIFVIVIAVLVALDKLSFLSSSKQTVSEPVIDPFDLIQKKLAQLKIQGKSLSEETYKEFFVEISEAVREFLSYTVMPLALETPTRDLIRILKEQQINQELLEIVSFILINSDRAKYAKQIFSDERTESVISESFKLISLVKKQKDAEKTNEL
ncbi:MAG: hypothetical protein ACRCTQ_03765 [Brevinemataceae bacterium]